MTDHLSDNEKKLLAAGFVAGTAALVGVASVAIAGLFAAVASKLAAEGGSTP